MDICHYSGKKTSRKKRAFNYKLTWKRGIKDDEIHFRHEVLKDIRKHGSVGQIEKLNDIEQRV